MKIGYLKADWLAPLVGLAVVGGSLLVATAYAKMEQRRSAAEALNLTLDQIHRDQQLSTALKSIHEGQGEAATQRLDLLLCGDVLRLNAQLESCGPRTRDFISDAFRRIALLRPKLGAGASGGAIPGEQAMAEKILGETLGGRHIAQSQ
jgi:outer membrane murein-binding lipoprotein Lpp